MNEFEFLTLNRGDIVRHKTSATGYVITANHGGRATAVKTIDITNPDEWDLVAKVEMYPKDGEPRFNEPYLLEWRGEAEWKK